MDDSPYSPDAPSLPHLYPPDAGLLAALDIAFERWSVLCTIAARHDGIHSDDLESELAWLYQRYQVIRARSTQAQLQLVLQSFYREEVSVRNGLRERIHVLPSPGGAQATVRTALPGRPLLCSEKFQHCAVFCPPSAMPAPNHFKRALKAGQPQMGLWSTLPAPYVSELIAGSGFDWLLLDTEHTPTDVPQMVQQLQAVAAATPRAGLGCSHAVVRPAWNDKVLIKRYLDIGAQTLLLPFVQNAGEARAAVEAVRYAPAGLRGMGGSMRASNFGRDADYVAKAADEICLLVQVETREALDNLEAIASVDGIDGVFIGPADLSASLGYPGNASHPVVEAAIDQALATIRACGKAPGILAVDPGRAQACLEAGALFVAVGMDMLLLRNAADALATHFKQPAAPVARVSLY